MTLPPPAKIIKHYHYTQYKPIEYTSPETSTLNLTHGLSCTIALSPPSRLPHVTTEPGDHKVRKAGSQAVGLEVFGGSS